MATEKQIAANRRNAAKSTGPRTELGKARARMNALRHGLAVALGNQAVMSDVVLEELSDRLARIETERGKLTFDIETRLWEAGGGGVDDLLHQLVYLERYARRCSSALRKR